MKETMYVKKTWLHNLIAKKHQNKTKTKTKAKILLLTWSLSSFLPSFPLGRANNCI
jgi:hypothetical protein